MCVATAHDIETLRCSYDLSPAELKRVERYRAAVVVAPVVVAPEKANVVASESHVGQEGFVELS